MPTLKIVVRSVNFSNDKKSCSQNRSVQLQFLGHVAVLIDVASIIDWVAWSVGLSVGRSVGLSQL